MGFLVGFMGAGKTTAGREVASRLDCRFIDLDDCIVARARLSVAEIFSKLGEREFRRRESQALLEVLRNAAHDSATLIALGGGAWPQPQNRLRIREFGGRVIFLDAPLPVLRQRCESGGAQRPLFADAASFEELYRARHEQYGTADVRIDTAGKAPGEVAEDIIAALQWDRTATQGEGS